MYTYAHGCFISCFLPRKCTAHCSLHIFPQDKNKSPYPPTTRIICRHSSWPQSDSPLEHWAAPAPTYFGTGMNNGDLHGKARLTHKTHCFIEEEEEKKLLFSDIFIKFSMTRGVHFNRYTTLEEVCSRCSLVFTVAIY